MKRICVGEITSAHGVRGFVKVRCFGDDPETLVKYDLYTSEDGAEIVHLDLKHMAGGALVAEVEGVADRNEAEKMRGMKLWVDRDALPELEDAYYHADLIGLEARGPDGAAIGTVISVQNFGASDLLEIKPESGKAFYLPFIDEYVGEIDLAARTVAVDIPEGLR